MARIFFIVACTLTAILNGGAQHPSFPIWQYTPDDGLPSSEVYFIHQDKKGYMWFATDRGLSRFDGKVFRNYGMKDGLQDLVVFQIAGGPGDKLWLKTLSNAIFILENDSIRPYPFNDLLINRTDHDLRFSSIFVDQEERLFFAASIGGFYRFTPGSNEISPVHHCEGVLVILDGEEWKGQSYCVGEKGWFDLSARQRFNNFAIRRDSFQVCIQTSYTTERITTALPPGPPYFFSPNIPRSVWTKTGGSAYLFQLYHTFFFVKNGQVQWTRFDQTEMECLFTSSDGSVWMGGRAGGGLRRYASPEDVHKGRFREFVHDLTITDIFEGRKGEIWVSTLENGVYCIPPVQIESFDESAGFPGKYFRDIAVKDSNIVYFTTQNRFLGELNLAAGTLSSVLMPSTSDYYVYWDSQEERLWASSNEISYLEKNNWITVPGHYTAAKEIWPLHTPSGTFAVTSPFGLIMVSSKNKALLAANKSTDFSYRYRTLCIHQDFSGRIWVGTPAGLKWVDDGRLATPPEDPPELKTRINALAELPDSTLVIGTQGHGLFFWKHGRLVNINEASGLVSDIVECLHVDQKGQLWVGARSGLNKLQWGGRGILKIRTLTTLQGLPSNQINVIGSSGNHIWLGTANGLAHFVDGAGLFRNDTTSTAPLLQSLQVGQEPWPLSGPFHFRHRQNDIIIQYAALDFLQRGNVTYRYRLSKSGKWTITRSNTVNFPALPPGNYRFEVQALAVTGISEIWSPSCTVSFTIDSPFWHKPWFFALLALATLGVTAAAWRLTLRRIRERNDRERRIRQLERSALQAQMNPHFIFNALNSIQGLIRTGEKQDASRYLAKFARLIRSILKQSRVEKVSLDDEISALRDYLDLERMRMDNRFEYRIEMTKEVDPFEITLPPMLIQPFLENAVKHGIGPKNTAGQIDLILSADGGFLHVTVRDNGVGIEQSLAKKNPDYIPENSVGMKITRERLRLLNGEKGRHKIEAREIKSSEGEALGTEVRFSIRYDN